jgi:hypothetical protein
VDDIEEESEWSVYGAVGKTSALLIGYGMPVSRMWTKLMTVGNAA